MAAPSATTRDDPVGIKLENGYRSLITFAADPDVSLWEMEVGHAGLDGGDPIDTSTMHNDTWRTKSPRALIDSSPFTCRFAFDPAVKSQLVSLVNVRTTVTVRFRDGSTEAQYGYLQTTEFDPMVEGEMPTGTATICPTNWDPTNFAEEGPVLTSVSGS